MNITGSDPLDQTFERGGETSERIVETFERGGETSERIVETFERGGETSERIVETFERGGETSERIVETFERGGETFEPDRVPSVDASSSSTEVSSKGLASSDDKNDAELPITNKFLRANVQLSVDGELAIVPVDEFGKQVQLSAEEITAIRMQVSNMQSQMDETNFTSIQMEVALPLKQDIAKVDRNDLDSDATGGYVSSAIPKVEDRCGANQPEDVKPVLLVCSLNGLGFDCGPGKEKMSDVDNIAPKFQDDETPATLVCNLNGLEFDGDAGDKEKMSAVDSISPVTSLFNNEGSPSTCPLCFKTFTLKGYMVKHMQTHEPDMFSCLECGKTFNLKGNLQKHMNTHSGKKQFECEECGKKFLLKGNLKKHILSHSDQKNYICLVCQKKFALKGNLQKHLSTHIKPFDCEHCMEAFSTQISLAKHVKLSHAESTIYECQMCGKQFHFMRYLRQHMECHEQDLFYTCSFCEQQFKTSALLKSHIRRAHTEPLEQCETCGKKYFTKHDLKRHVETHSEYRPYGCEICGKNFYRKSVLVKHLNIHKDYACDKCGASFSKEEKLQQHMSVPCGADLSCPVCQQSFTRRANLKRHMLYHKGKRAFKCHICSQMFTRKESMQRHLMRHNDIKPHSCDFCGKRFVSAWNLKTHRYTHTGECPYKCVQCGKGFRSTWNRSIHMSTHTGKKAYKCQVCKMEYATYTSLHRHSATHYHHLNARKRNKKHAFWIKMFNSKTDSSCKKTASKKNVGCKSKFSLSPIRKPNKCSLCSKRFWSPLFLKSHVANHRVASTKTIKPNMKKNNHEAFKSLQVVSEVPEAKKKAVHSAKDVISTQWQKSNDGLLLPSPMTKPIKFTIHSKKFKPKISKYATNTFPESNVLQELDNDVKTTQNVLTSETAIESNLQEPIIDVKRTKSVLQSKVLLESDLQEPHVMVKTELDEMEVQEHNMAIQVTPLKPVIASDIPSSPQPNTIPVKLCGINVHSSEHHSGEMLSNKEKMVSEDLDVHDVCRILNNASSQPDINTFIVSQKSHTNLVKTESANVECYVCGKEFKNSSQLKRHMKTHQAILSV